MTAQNMAPVIIKRKKVVSGGGHHGGAWKVAYADFVTAMMAFFMLMWLLNATTEKQRKGLADYFTPTIPVARISGGGDGAFGGDSTMAELVLAQNGTGGLVAVPLPPGKPAAPNQDSGGSDAENDFAKIEEALLGLGGESFEANELLRHIVTKVTDEGLVIEVFEKERAQLFDRTTGEPTVLLTDIANVIVPLLKLVLNGVAIEGHVRTEPIVLANNRTWDVSTQNAHRARVLLENIGLDKKRIQRVVGHSNRTAASDNLLSVRNNRLEFILLRKK